LTTQTLLVQEAKRLNLDQDPTYLVRRELMSNELLLNRYYQYVVENNPASDDILNKFYQTHPDVMAGEISYSAKHIIVTPKKDMKIFNSTGTDATSDAAHLVKLVSKTDGNRKPFDQLTKKEKEKLKGNFYRSILESTVNNLKKQAAINIQL